MQGDPDSAAQQAAPRLPLVVDPAILERHLGAPWLRVVDLSKADIYARFHVPGAVPLDYARLVTTRGPARGALPDAEQLADVLSSIGLTADMHVVAYDDEGGGKAGRLLWTLDVLGHRHMSLLDGGLHAWLNEGHPTSDEPAVVSSSTYPVNAARGGVADAEYIMERLGDARMAILDVRAPREYMGLTRSAMRNGHIPGAVNLEWTFAMDPSRNLRLRPDEELRTVLEERGVTPDKEVIVHCQTHHRSAHTYILLKALGYPRVLGYAGSWSEWGNREDTQVEE